MQSVGVNNQDFNELQLSLARQLKAARKSAGLSQEALALSADVDRTYVSQLERGVANPSLQVLFRLAQVLGVTLRVAVGNDKV